jgi:hypothetical protein
MTGRFLISVLCLASLLFSGRGNRVRSQGLIARYPFENGSARDESSNGNNGTAYGGTRVVADRFGNPCGAIELDGKTGYIEVPANPSLATPQYGISLTGWVRITVEPGISYRGITLFCKGEDAEERPDNPQYRFQVFQFQRNSTVSLNTLATPEDPAWQAHPLPLETWFHTAMVFTGTDIIFYLNGAEAFRHPFSLPLQPNRHPLHIGRDNPGRTEFFAGALDDLEIYNRSLSPQEILDFYMKSAAPGGTAAGSPYVLPDMPDVTLRASPTTGKARADWRPPTAPSQPCKTLSVRQLGGPKPGTEVEPGSQTITYALMDGGEILALQAFRLVVDPPAPAPRAPVALRLNCPSDTAWTSADSTGTKFVHFPPAVRSAEGRTTARLLSGPPSGSQLPPGDYQLVYEIQDETGAKERCLRKIKISYSQPQIPPRQPAEVTFLKEKPASEPVARPEVVAEPRIRQVPIPPPPLPPPPPAPVVAAVVPVARPTVPEKPVFPHIEDSIQVQARATLKDRNFTLVSYDNVVADGDRIAIYLNDSLVVADKTLKNHPKDRKLGRNMIDGFITLRPGRNFLIVKALNTGNKGLNTATVRLYQGQVNKETKMGTRIAFSTALSAKQGIAGALEIYSEP